MTSKLRNLVAMCLMPFAVVSCTSPTSDPETPPEAFTIKAVEQIVGMRADETSRAVKITTNLPEFKAQLLDAATWLTVSATPVITSNVVLTPTQNDDINTRSARVLVCSMDEKVRDTITVSQLGIAPDLLINVDSVFKTDKNGTTLAVIVTTNAPYEIVCSDPTWLTDLPTKAMVAYNHNIKIEVNTGIPRVGTITMRTKDADPTKVVQKVITVSQSSAGGDIVVPKDILYRPIDARVSDFQPGAGANLVFDGDQTTLWHSSWTNAAFPKYLECDVPTEAATLDYIVPYMRSGNGAWGKVELVYNTRDNAQWVKVGDYNFSQSGGAKPLFFDAPLANVKTFRFNIAEGSNSNASCLEVEFFKYNNDNSLSDAILAVFKTLSCSALNDNVTDEQIAKLPDLLQQIAVAIRTSTYENEFRRGVYTAHSTPEFWAAKLRSKKWGQADNPTGIWAEAGQKIYVLVGPTWGNKISLFSCDAFVGAHGDDYLLNEGVNEITVRNNGLFYVKYYVNDLHAANAKPIEVHIAEGSGYVNGYWDVEKHKTDAEYARLYKLSTKPFRMFDIVGRYAHLIYSRGFIPEEQIVDAFAWYDKLCWWDWEIMGVDKMYTNGDLRLRHVFVSNDVGYMDASDYRTHYHESTLMARLKESTMKSNRDMMWGPAHEVGHQHQPVFNFNGYSEASNNFFSNLFTWKSEWGKKSRGQGVQSLIDAAYYSGPVDLGTKEVPEIKEFDRLPFVLYARVPDNVVSGAVFLMARQYWQLYTYYHIAGRDTQFWPKFFENLRNGPVFTIKEPQANAMSNYILACDAAKQDLTDFFDLWGYFVPCNFVIDDYGKQTHTLTQAMIDQAQATVKSRNYPKAGPIEYIEDRDAMDAEDTGWNDTRGNTGYWTSYRDNAKIKSNISVTTSGDNFTVNNWEGAAAFELHDGSKITFRSVMANFTISSKLRTATAKLYAVQVDGQRIQIWPK